jgi:hypothetical protein
MPSRPLQRNEDEGSDMAAPAPKKAARVKALISQTRKTVDQTQMSMLRAEDTLAGLEDREARRVARGVR